MGVGSPAEPQISLGKIVFSNGFHLVSCRPGHSSLPATLPEHHSRFSDIAVPDRYARSPATRLQVTDMVASLRVQIQLYSRSKAASRSTALCGATSSDAFPYAHTTNSTSLCHPHSCHRSANFQFPLPAPQPAPTCQPSAATQTPPGREGSCAMGPGREPTLRTQHAAQALR